MSIIHRLWPKDKPTADPDPPLAQRLKDLVGQDTTSDSESGASVAGGPTPTNESAPVEE